MTRRPPTADEINIFDSLDERTAERNFLGKNREQARALFSQNFLKFQEDLMWMGPAAFRYYVHAALDYLVSDAAALDSSAASSFAMLLEFRLEHEAAELAPVSLMLQEGIRLILADFARFGCLLDIHGDVAQRYLILLARPDELAH
jgi:hypothetical protein